MCLCAYTNGYCVRTVDARTRVPPPPPPLWCAHLFVCVCVCVVRTRFFRLASLADEDAPLHSRCVCAHAKYASACVRTSTGYRFRRLRGFARARTTNHNLSQIDDVTKHRHRSESELNQFVACRVCVCMCVCV